MMMKWNLRENETEDVALVPLTMGEGPRAKDCRLSLEAREDKKGESPLESPKRMQCCTFI